ncbi:MAG: SDR family oxidoreductase [Actinobacteria bacterium]|nr:SDR family oxidoreductase [Actinomycetota bacterium]
MNTGYNSLHNKIAIVTGAGSGVGRAIALKLAELKIHVCMLDISKEKMEETSGIISRAGNNSDCFLCDVSNEEDVSTVFDKIEKMGEIYSAVNNAGIAPQESYSIADAPVELWDRIMEINVKGYFLVTKYAEKYFIRKSGMSENKRYGQGSIVYVCSNSGIFGSKKNIYGISNASRICMMRQAALEMGDYGVRANAVIPGDILEGSGIWDEKYLAQRASAKGLSIEETKKYYETRAPLGMKATAEQVAKIVAALIPAGGIFENTTGQIIRCDGGQIMM